MKSCVKFLCLVPLVMLGACTGLPSGVEPVQNFELNKYLGK